MPDRDPMPPNGASDGLPAGPADAPSNGGFDEGSGRLLQAVDLSRFQPDHNTRLAIKPDGLDYRVPARYLGMEQRSYLILHLTALGGAAQEVYPYLYKDNPVRIFLAAEGALQGYLSRIIAYTTSPYRHLYVSYPHQGEFFTLREHDRFECHLPARMASGASEFAGREFTGMVADISQGGCSVVLAAEEDEAGAFGLGEEVVLRFSMLSLGRESEVLSTVRNLRRGGGPAGGKIALGLSFSALTPLSAERIGEFLAYLGRFRRAGAALQAL